MFKTTSRQTTLRNAVRCAGTGLHTGAPVSMRLEPAEPDSGYRFFRTDIASGLPLPARARFVSDTRNRVVIEREGVRVETVEHLLAALYAGGIDNCDIRLDGPEVPAMDGSAAPFFDLLEEAGTAVQEAEARRLRLDTPVWIGEGDRFLIALPGDGLRITATVDFPHPEIGVQTLSLEAGVSDFRSDVAPARTFGFLRDRRHFEERGLGRGASGETALLYGPDRLEAGERRFPDEAVRHKVLDLVGDLALLGRRLEAHLVAHRGGHALDLALVRRIEAVVGGREGLLRPVSRSGAKRGEA